MSGLNSKLGMWIGMASAATILLGCIFKAFHLQGAAFVFVVGMLLFCFGFIPIVMVGLFKRGQGVLALGSVFSSTTDFRSALQSDALAVCQFSHRLECEHHPVWHLATPLFKDFQDPVE